MSIARNVLAQAFATAQRVQGEAERILHGLVWQRSGSSVDLPGEAGRLLAKLEDRVARLRKDFQELERVHQALHNGAEPLQEVQDLHRRISQIEKRLSDSRTHATQPAS
jgi:hypothetical protein